MIGLPPSSAGFVQLTVMKVASISTATVGEPGISEEEQDRSAEMRTYDLHGGYGRGFWVGVCVHLLFRDPFRYVFGLKAKF